TVAIGSKSDVLRSTLAYLPTGLAYALLAPFVWQITRPLDVLTVPEMLFWYVSVLAAIWTGWKHRRRWQLFVPMSLFVMGVIGVCALAEGNVGTLFRHRAMIIPFTMIMAAPAYVSIVTAIARRRRPA